MLSLGGKSTWLTSVTEFNVCITRLGLVYDSGNDKQMNDGVSNRRWDQVNENHWKMKTTGTFFYGQASWDYMTAKTWWSCKHPKLHQGKSNTYIQMTSSRFGSSGLDVITSYWKLEKIETF